MLTALAVLYFLQAFVKVEDPPLATTFADWTNRTELVGAASRTIARGRREWPLINRSVDVEVIAALVTPQEADAIVGILSNNVAFDEDRDSVDDAKTFEFYLSKSGTTEALASIRGKPDRLARIRAQRQPVREAVAAITTPIVEERLLPWLRARFPSAPPLQLCFSFIRRYRDGERLTHKAHFDIQAYATVVVSLSDVGVDFDGGLYVSASGDGAREWIALRKGDAVAHQSDFLHGVDVTRGERWSWVMWFKPAASPAECPASPMAEWHVAGATEGDPVAAFLTARRARSPKAKARWLKRSADGGFTRALNEIGAAHLFGTGGAAVNESAALEYLTRAAPHEADAAFNLGLLALRGEGSSAETIAVQWFARAASMGSLQGASNMGVAFFRGAGGLEVDLDAAAMWFERVSDGAAMFSLAAIARERTPPLEAVAQSWEQKACTRTGHAASCQAVAARRREL